MDVSSELPRVIGLAILIVFIMFNIYIPNSMEELRTLFTDNNLLFFTCVCYIYVIIYFSSISCYIIFGLKVRLLIKLILN